MLYLNGHELIMKKFGTGEVKIEKKVIKDALARQHEDSKKEEFKNKIPTIVITYWHEDGKDESDLYNLYTIKRYLDMELKNMYTVNYLIHLNLAAAPYGRMDRPNEDYLFTLKYFCDYVNDMKFDRVNILEPHSSIILGNMNNAHGVSVVSQLVNQCRTENSLTSDNTAMLYPDCGAQKKYVQYVNSDYFLVGFKTRDFATGNITRLKLAGDTPPEPFNVIILDDIMATGGTVLRVIDKLKSYDIAKIFVIMTHSENSLYQGGILECPMIHKIYTTDSMHIRIDRDRDICNKLKINNINPVNLEELNSTNIYNNNCFFK